VVPVVVGSPVLDEPVSSSVVEPVVPVVSPSVAEPPEVVPVSPSLALIVADVGSVVLVSAVAVEVADSLSLSAMSSPQATRVVMQSSARSLMARLLPRPTHLRRYTKKAFNVAIMTQSA
jgi:hypothetical protein